MDIPPCNAIARLHLPELDSTNHYALANFAELPERVLITAGSQTRGRGRRGRKWQSPPGENFYGTLLIKNPAFPLYSASWLGGLAALYTLRQINNQTEFRLKWPNDILCGKSKICGVLAETHCTSNSNHIDGIALGIGINLNMPGEELAKIDRPATSILFETGAKCDLEKFTNAIADSLSKFMLMAEEKNDQLRRIWINENFVLGQNVIIIPENGSSFHGKVEDFGTQGEIILRCEDGNRINVFSGDVSLQIANSADSSYTPPKP